jgi:hypothetical protein
MLIWLVDFDGKIENLALMRLSTWHKAQGHTVRLKFGDARPELFETPDLVYISCLYKWNRRAALYLKDAWGDRAVIGGTGFSALEKLPKGARFLQPDYDLYGNDRAIGFISRGCNRSCPWCIVPLKEGNLRRVSTARDVVQDKKEALFLDNNFLALRGFEDDLRWLARKGIKVDFNQGLDARHINAESARLLAACKWSLPGGQKIRLALDGIGQMLNVEHAVGHLGNAGINPNRVFVYCLIGYAGLESDVKRLLFLRDLGVSVYPMGYKDLKDGSEPAKGWDRRLYKKYKRLIIRMPFAKSVWQDFGREVVDA